MLLAVGVARPGGQTYCNHMRTLHLILLVIAALLFAMAAFVPVVDPNARPTTISRFNFIAAGLFAWVLVPLSDVIDSIAND